MRPLGIGVEFDPGHAGQPGLDLIEVLTQQLLRNLRTHAKHQFLPFAGGFHRFGGELRRAGDEGNGGWYHVLRRGIQNDAYLGAEPDTPGHGLGQEEGEVYVRQVDQVQDTSARTQHLAGLRHAHLHPTVTRRAQFAVADIGFDAIDTGRGSGHAGPCADQLRFGGLDRGAGSGGLCFAGRERRLCAPYARSVIVQLLYRGGAFLG